MEYQRRGKSLVVLTLLQLCRAEIKDTPPQWYSANIINDGFQPKSISEIFSTEPSFSTASPIIVSSDYGNGYSGEVILSSSPAPPTNVFSTTSSGITRHTNFNPEAVAPLQQQYLPHMTTSTQRTSPQFDQTSVEIPQKTSQSDLGTTRSLLVSEIPTQPQRNVQIQQEQSTSWTFRPSSTVTETPTIFQSPVTDPTLSGQIRYELPQSQSTIGVQETPGPQQIIPQSPNYFLIYQQAPQSVRSIFDQAGVQTFPSSPQTTVQESFTTTSPVSRTFPSTQTSTLSSFSTVSSTPSTIPSSTPTTIRTSPVLISTTNTPVTQELSSLTTPSTPRVSITSTSTLGSSSSRNSRTTNIADCRYPTTPMPSTIYTDRPPGIDSVLFPLKIRVLSPSGSITNVNINPVNKVPATTKKPTTTTTRRPTTKRTPKPKKNTYERCLHGCRKHGQNLCAAPLGQNPIDPENLRGFPSVCHMACHNSYRKIPYEKIIDGSCGKLRTRIRPIDSNTKLKKDELHKVQYILDNPGQQKAIVEFTGLYT